MSDEEEFPSSTAAFGHRSSRRTLPNRPQHTSPFQEELGDIQQTTDRMLSQLGNIERRLSRGSLHQSVPGTHAQRSTPMMSTTLPRQGSSSNDYPLRSSQAPRQGSSSTDYPVLTPQNHHLPDRNSTTLSSHHRLLPSHQVKSVPMFTGRDQGATIAIEDWVRDVNYLIETTSMPEEIQFSTIVRYLGGAARKLVLNLHPTHQTPSHAFAELKAQFGDVFLTGDPLASFYERVKHPTELPSIYAVELEATLRTIEEKSTLSRPFPNRNSMLTQQFMRGVKDEKVTQRLAPMKPRDMTFRELQIELRQLERESRIAAAAKTGTKLQAQQLQQIRPPYQQSSPKVPDVKSPKPTTDHDVLQELLATVHQLALRVDHISHQTPRGPQQPRTDQHASGQRVFYCHRCGNEGHIAKGCRSAPLNSNGPRPMGKPSEAGNQRAQ